MVKRKTGGLLGQNARGARLFDLALDIYKTGNASIKMKENRYPKSGSEGESDSFVFLTAIATLAY